MSHGYGALTEKEKATLRLIVRGHDAKSIARHFDLSVHTINERLRDARRKLAVPSSREAARLLFEHERPTPESIGDQQIGEAARYADGAQLAASHTDREQAHRLSPRIIGVAVMTLALTILAVAIAPHVTETRAPGLSVASAAAQEAVDARIEASARRWLGLVDEGRWDESWRATGSQFRQLNTVRAWAAASEKVRTPLGALRSRTLLSQDYIPAPPQGYAVIRFRTSFANKADTVETLSLAEEGGEWRVVGITIG